MRIYLLAEDFIKLPPTFSAIPNLEQEKPKNKRPATDLHGFAQIFKPIGENP